MGTRPIVGGAGGQCQTLRRDGILVSEKTGLIVSILYVNNRDIVMVNVSVSLTRLQGVQVKNIILGMSVRMLLDGTVQ